MANNLPPEQRRNVIIAVRLTPGDAKLVGAAYDRYAAGTPAPMRPSEYHRTILLSGANAFEEAIEAANGAE